MMQEGLKHFAEIPLMVFGMILFFVTYIGVVAATLVGPKTKERMRNFGDIPLREED